MISENILKEIRHCIHSELLTTTSVPKVLPIDYTCMKKNNQPCVLLKEPFCEIREEFPEKYNT